VKYKIFVEYIPNRQLVWITDQVKGVFTSSADEAKAIEVDDAGLQNWRPGLDAVFRGASWRWGVTAVQTQPQQTPAVNPLSPAPGKYIVEVTKAGTMAWVGAPVGHGDWLIEYNRANAVEHDAASVPAIECKCVQYGWKANPILVAPPGNQPPFYSRSFPLQYVIGGGGGGGGGSVDWVSSQEISKIAKGVAKTGFNCKRCNEKNDYAAANQPDGSYVCFNCR
jgi:hypothetical protein